MISQVKMRLQCFEIYYEHSYTISRAEDDLRDAQWFAG
jgi:hypothetical protein